MTRPTCECGAAGIHPYPVAGTFHRAGDSRGQWALACDDCKRAMMSGDTAESAPDDWDVWARDHDGADWLTVQAPRRLAAGERAS